MRARGRPLVAPTNKTHVIANQSADWCGNPLQVSGMSTGLPRRDFVPPRNDVDLLRVRCTSTNYNLSPICSSHYIPPEARMPDAGALLRLPGIACFCHYSLESCIIQWPPAVKLEINLYISARNQAQFQYFYLKNRILGYIMAQENHKTNPNRGR